MHPSLETQVKSKLNKLLAARIIFPVKHTHWISNLFHVRNKSGEIRLCVDFKNVNKASEKDNDPVPPMKKILQCVYGSEMLSLLNGFSGYNQVRVAHDDQLKTFFRTKWGTYAYKKIPIGLDQLWGDLSKKIDIDFRGLIRDCVVVYLDDVTIFSKYQKYHIAHLRRVFNRCRKYAISLNPKKMVFAVDEGILLGFIVSKHGMRIDPERTEEISKNTPPHNKNSMQSFLGKINVLRRFVPSFAETVKPLQDMIKKNREFKWGPREKDYFDRIKEEIV
jgi:hypothetical protein